MSDVSVTENPDGADPLDRADHTTPQERQARYVARRAAHTALRLVVQETPGQEYWAIFRKQSDFEDGE